MSKELPGDYRFAVVVVVRAVGILIVEGQAAHRWIWKPPPPFKQK
jgi:hypothetical protein